MKLKKLISSTAHAGFYVQIAGIQQVNFSPAISFICFMGSIISRLNCNNTNRYILVQKSDQLFYRQERMEKIMDRSMPNG